MKVDLLEPGDISAGIVHAFWFLVAVFLFSVFLIPQFSSNSLDQDFYAMQYESVSIRSPWFTDNDHFIELSVQFSKQFGSPNDCRIVDLNFELSRMLPSNHTTAVANRNMHKSLHFQAQHSEFLRLFSSRSVFPVPYFGSLSLAGNISGFNRVSFRWTMGHPAMSYFTTFLQLLCFIVVALPIGALFFDIGSFSLKNVSTELRDSLTVSLIFVWAVCLGGNPTHSLFLHISGHLLNISFQFLLRIFLPRFLMDCRWQGIIPPVESFITAVSMSITLCFDGMSCLVLLFSYQAVDQLNMERLAFRFSGVADIVYFVFLVWKSKQIRDSLDRSEGFRFRRYRLDLLHFAAFSTVVRVVEAFGVSSYLMRVPEVVLMVARLLLVHDLVSLHSPVLVTEPGNYRQIGGCEESD
jgi:hypothetical protein